jgi:hypothetical protein
MTDQPQGLQNEGLPSPEQAQDRPVRQLETIIQNLTTYATPVLREIAARAAELAAKAGEAAGPMAHRAAEMTEDLGDRVADKGREIATDLRREPAGATTGSGAGVGEHPYASPDTHPGDTGTEAWADTRAGSVVEPGTTASPATTFLEEPQG